MVKISFKRNLVCFLIYFSVFHILAAPPEIKKEKISIKMNDGVELSADMYSPEEHGKLPVVLIRSPYGKEQYFLIAKSIAENGYIAISQDARGTGESGGINIAFINEANDGLETLRWISSQEWYNGKIGMWGSSYNAYCADIAASANTGLLNSVFSISGGTNLGKSLLPGGAFHLMMNMTWLHFSKSFRDTSLNRYKPADLMNITPLIDGFAMIGADKDVSAIGNFVSSLEELDIPRNTAFLHLTGWYDFFNVLTFDLYDKIKTVNGASNKIIIGPWHHDQIYGDKTKVGDEDFGVDSQLGMKKLITLIIQWFDYTLKGTQNGISAQKNANIFIMGQNRWEQFDGIPPSGSGEYVLYLNSSGSANSSSGNGILKSIIDEPDKNDSFIFDPLNPVPTYGGANFHFFRDLLGVKDQSETEKRNDVLVYTSEPMKENTRFIGKVNIVLYASSEGISTDYTAKLVEVQDNGYCKIICEGIKRLEKITPGNVIKAEIDLGYTAIEVPEGNKLRLEISSSNFPKYDRNPNTGVNALFAGDFVKVKQTVYYGKNYPSKLILHAVK